MQNQVRREDAVAAVLCLESSQALAPLLEEEQSVLTSCFSDDPDAEGAAHKKVVLQKLGLLEDEGSASQKLLDGYMEQHAPDELPLLVGPPPGQLAGPDGRQLAGRGEGLLPDGGRSMPGIHGPHLPAQESTGGASGAGETNPPPPGGNRSMEEPSAAPQPHLAGTDTTARLHGNGGAEGDAGMGPLAKQRPRAWLQGCDQRPSGAAGATGAPPVAPGRLLSGNCTGYGVASPSASLRSSKVSGYFPAANIVQAQPIAPHLPCERVPRHVGEGVGQLGGQVAASRPRPDSRAEALALLDEDGDNYDLSFLEELDHTESMICKKAKT